MSITDIPHKTIATYTGRTLESMRQCKKKYETDGSGMWPHYVKSYLWTQAQAQPKDKS